MARRSKKLDKAMSLEESARRMTALLARPPRNKTTRQYMEAFPKREKLTVRAEDYPIIVADDGRFAAEPIVRKEVTKPVCDTPRAHSPRKDRLRPRRRPATESRWACRDNGRHREHRSRSAPKLIRTIGLTMYQRFMLYVAQDGICGLCGKPMIGRPFSFSLDHVIPRSLDAEEGLGNLLLCHGECNGVKTNDIPTGCEMVFLLSVNARLGLKPDRF